MFSFFRRQGKKQSGGSKKLKKQVYINELQCVPVDNYQVDCCKPYSEDNTPYKPSLPPLIVMGNSESAKKCSTESLDAGYQSDSPTKLNNHVYSPKADVKDTTEFQWDTAIPPRQLPEDNLCTATSSPVSDSGDILGYTKVDRSSLSRMKEIFLKAQTTSSPPSSDAVLGSQPPLAVQEDLDACDTLSDVISSFCTSARDDNPVSNENCDRHVEYFDSTINQRVDETTVVVLEESPSVCSNAIDVEGDDDDEFEEVENKEEDSSDKRDFQIPNITITESSDSDGESDDDLQAHRSLEQHYDRTYPTILYDITEVEEPFSDASDVDTNSFTDDKRSFVQEPKFQEQIIKSLKCELESKDTENMQLKGKINDLQRDVLNKTWGMDRLHAELASFQTEADCVRKKLLRVEDDLVRYKNKNMELNEELLKTLEKESNFELVNELQSGVEELKLLIRNLQTQLEATQAEKQQLQAQLVEIESEKNERLKTVEMTLDETLKQKEKLQAHFDAEYEKLRTLNTDREQQLVDDFEWKLREVEIVCKRKLEDKDKANEEKVKQIRKQLEAEIGQLREQMKKIEKLKSYEAEAIQLRGLTQEQERSLRTATRTADQLHSDQRCLNEEVDKLRHTLEKERAHLATVQGIHSREIAEKERKHTFRLEQQKNEINAEWESKVHRESARLRLDIEKQYKDEKRKLLDEAKSKAEQQLKENNEIWNKKLTECKKQLEALEIKLAEQESSYREELVKLQTNSDRDMLGLRRKLDKMDLKYQEQLEKKQEQHEIEIENLREEYEKRLQQSEQNCAQQVSSTRATLELVKEQLQREAEAQTEVLNKKYTIQLEQQHDRLAKEKEDAISQVQKKCSEEMYALQSRLNEELTAQEEKGIQMLNVINDLKLQLMDKTNDVNVLHETHDTLQNIIAELRDKITINDNLRKEAETTLKNKEIEYTDTLTKIRERYEAEIKQLQLKLATLERNIANMSTEEKTPESPVSNNSNYNIESFPTSNQSKSSRRRNRGRHRNNQQKNPQLTHQFSL